MGMMLRRHNQATTPVKKSTEKAVAVEETKTAKVDEPTVKKPVKKSNK